MTNNERREVDLRQDGWDEHNLSQLRYFRSLSLRAKLGAVEGMADVVRHFQSMRNQGKFRAASRGAAQPRVPPSPALREPESRYGSTGDRHEVALRGCTPEPLMNYLKALGILRLVGEDSVHGDPGARGFWRDGVFVLRSALDEQSLIEFFRQRYRPTPIVVPWSGNDFFDVNPVASNKVFKKTPSGSKVIEAFLANDSDRLSGYRGAITIALEALKTSGIEKKAQMEKPDAKARYLEQLRRLADPGLVQWIDAAAVIRPDKAVFSSLLGSGGGSDGNTHFSDNFMQNLWEMLPEFDCQRAQPERAESGRPDEVAKYHRNCGLIRSALFGEPVGDLPEKRTSSLFDSGAVGGPNATQGMERESLTNPWNFILGLEGALLFVGAVSKRAGASGASASAFPFQFQFSTTDADRSVLKEQAGREIWLPLWQNPVALPEIRLLLGEGRAEVGQRAVRRGVDMARAVTCLGVDRGIGAFHRFAIIRGRVGGKNYNTAVSLGRIHVRMRQYGDLLLQLDPWLDRFRGACKIGQKEEAPARITEILRRIDSTVFDYCRYGGQREFQSVLIALGQAERELMRDGSWAAKNRVPPLAGLSPDWVAATNDGSAEFELALSLASVHDSEFKLGSLRSNLEPAILGERKDGTVFANWVDKDRAVVWNSADLPGNLSAVLGRRVIDGARKGCERLPLTFRHAASLDAISAFVAGDTDDRRLEELLWGLMLTTHESRQFKSKAPSAQIEAPPLPRAYALLKLLFVPYLLVQKRDADGRPSWRYARNGEEGIEIRPEPRILTLLRADRVGEACEIAARRVRASGLIPMPHDSSGSRTRDRVWHGADKILSGNRLAAALLVPISSHSVNRLIRMVMRGNEESETEPFAFEGETA